MDDLRARISFQRDIRDCNIICLTETWLTPSVPDTCCNAVWQLLCFTDGQNSEAGKSKGGGVCFMTNKKWCDPRNISSLSRSCSPHSGTSIHYLPPILFTPRVLRGHRYCRLHPTTADTSLALSKLHDVISGYINQTSWRCFYSSRGILTKPNLRQVMPNFHPHVSCPTRGPNTLDHCYSQFKNAYKARSLPALVSLTTRHLPHTGITNKGSHRNPRWRGKWRVGPPTLKLCCSRLLMTSTGTCSGRAHLTSASSRMVAVSFVNTLTEQATETIT